MNWNDRFDTPDYVYGTSPSQVLRTHTGLLVPGQTALSIADGEGRNSVFMAERGMKVTAFDGAPKAVEKARKLAEDWHVEVETSVADILDYDWDAQQYDLVVGIFFQFLPPEERAQVFDGMIRATKHGGTILVHGYTVDQLEHGTGGPRVAEQLYTEAMLREAFAGCEIVELTSYEKVLEEGAGHSGPSALVDMVARRH